MLVDTHCHLNLLAKKEFDVPLEDNFKESLIPFIEAAHKREVTTIINVGTNVVESNNCIRIAQAFDNCYSAVGIHPTDTNTMDKEDCARIKSLVEQKEANKIVAIGEVGLDYYHPHDKKKQYEVFEFHINLALEAGLPVIIHTRNAQDEVLDIIEYFKSPELKGVIHCFSEDEKFAVRALKLNFMLGIGGTLTYPKNQHLRDIFTMVHLESILLETDAPFLAPQAIRGKQNTPEQIYTIAHYLADIRNTSYEVIASHTTSNAQRIFKI